MEVTPFSLIGHNLNQVIESTNYRFKQSCKTIINAELIIGRLSANCKGNGICKMLPIDNLIAKSKCSAIKCTLIKKGDNQLNAVFFAQSCCSRIRQKVFANNSFIIEEPFFLPDWVKTALSYKNDNMMMIPIGVYPIIKLGEYTLIRFELHNSIHGK
ncbi:MAG: hypothetical protein MI974_26320 [Chitinophagales bacterium]|nr:hypothetical protein [Chitinophagales bacterium]